MSSGPSSRRRRAWLAVVGDRLGAWSVRQASRTGSGKVRRNIARIDREDRVEGERPAKRQVSVRGRYLRRRSMKVRSRAIMGHSIARKNYLQIYALRAVRAMRAVFWEILRNRGYRRSRAIAPRLMTKRSCKVAERSSSGPRAPPWSRYSQNSSYLSVSDQHWSLRLSQVRRWSRRAMSSAKRTSESSWGS